jgi:CPA2 family monovalent cation:H+ antiporter-2
MKLIDYYIYPIIVAVSVLTIFLTPYIMKLSNPFYYFLEKNLHEKWLNRIDNNKIKTSRREKNLWENLLIALVKIIAIYSIVIIAIFLLILNYFPQFLSSVIEFESTKIVAGVISLLLVAPLIRAIIAKKNHSKEYRQLWKKDKNNQDLLIALTFFRIVIGIGFVMYVLYDYLDLHFFISLVISIAYIVLILYSRWIKLISIRLERIFLFNLNSREYLQTNLKKDFNKNRLYKQLEDYDIHFSDFEINSTHTLLIGKRLKDLKFHQRYGVHLVSIIRGAARINIPGGNEALYPYDKILVLGTDEQIQKFKEDFKNLSNTRSNEEKMHGVQIAQFTVSKGSHWTGKSILESSIREEYSCMIVGIAKNGKATMNPNVNTIFEEGDIVWIAGETAKIRRFLKGEKSLSITDEQ